MNTGWGRTGWGPAGVHISPDEISMLEPLLRRTLPSAGVHSPEAQLHRALQRSLARWMRTKLIDSRS